MASKHDIYFVYDETLKQYDFKGKTSEIAEKYDMTSSAIHNAFKVGTRFKNSRYTIIHESEKDNFDKYLEVKRNAQTCGYSNDEIDKMYGRNFRCYLDILDNEKLNKDSKQLIETITLEETIKLLSKANDLLIKANFEDKNDKYHKNDFKKVKELANKIQKLCEGRN